MERREGYAKCALILFYPFYKVASKDMHSTSPLDDLKIASSYWRKFISVGGLKPVIFKNSVLGSPDQINSRTFWHNRKQILQNMQSCKTVKRKMKRPMDLLVLQTSTPKSIDNG